VRAQTGYTVAGIYAGLPPDVQPPAYVDDRPTIWQKHFWMFMVVIILLLIALITGVLCCICWYCCRKTDDKAKQPPVTCCSASQNSLDRAELHVLD